MTTQNILTADVLDIVFENRNKAYGAYTLRKYYDKRLMQSIGIMLLIVSSVILLSFRFGKKPVTHDNNTKAEVVIKTFNITPDEVRQPETPMEKQVKQIKRIETIKATANIVIVPDNKVLPKDVVPTQSEMEHKLISNTNSSGGTFDGQATKPGNENDTKSSGDIADEESLDPKNVIDFADIPPSYPGGIEALQNFLLRNLRTPDELESGQEASVKVKFVVNYDGEMYGYDVVQSGGGAFDNEVIRVLKKMPKWNPGKYKGRSVSVYYVIPVKFEATEE